MSLEVFRPIPESASVALSEAGKALNESLAKFNSDNVLFLSSGGSSIPLLDTIDPTSLGERVTFTLLDERFSTDNLSSNFHQISKLPFFKRASDLGVHFIDTKTRWKDRPEDLSARYVEALNEWLSSNPYGKIVATVGIGPDGHVAGIMPFPEDPEKFQELFEGDSLVVSYDAYGKNRYSTRITTTMPFLRKINRAICYVVGEEKRMALDAVFDSKGSLSETPGRILRELEGEVTIFTDQHIDQ